MTASLACSVFDGARAAACEEATTVKLGLEAKALAAILVVVSAFLAASSIIAHRRTETVVARGKAAELDAELGRYLSAIDTFTDNQEARAASLAHLGEWLYRTSRSDRTLDARAASMDIAVESMRAVSDRAILGAGLWYEPYVLDPSHRWVGAYAVANLSGEPRPTWEYSNDAYAYTQHAWYTIAVPTRTDQASAPRRDRFMTEPYADTLAGRPTVFVTFTHRMRSPEGRVVGVATADWTFDTLAASLRRFRATPHSFAFLVDEPSGKILFPTGRDQLRRLGDVAWGRRVARAHPAAGRIVRIENVRIEGRRFDVLVTRTSAGFVFGLCIATDEAYAAIDRLATETFGLAALSLLLVALATYWVVSRLLAPIRDLAASARIISAGDLEHRATITTTDEIGDLARAFNDAYGHVKKSEARFRALIENASDVIAILGPGAIFHYASPAMRRVLGYAPADLEGRSLYELAHEDDRAHASEVLGAVDRAHPISSSVELRVRAADGSYRRLEMIGAFLPDGEGTDTIVVNARDVTDRRAAEDALRRSEEQLRQAQKLEAVGRLAGGVAHDFNNAMTAVLGHAQLLLRRYKGDERLRTGLSEIEAAGEYAASLTRQLLTFSRRSPVDPAPIDLNQVVSGIDRMLARLIGENLEVETSLEPSLPSIYADRTHIEQVIVNLVVNARDAVEHGGRITLATRRDVLTEPRDAVNGRLEPGEYVSLVVTDTGVGMNATTLAHVFDPFFTTKDVGRGTGLGLSTVYGIVEESGARIFVESEPGRGTCFTIAWPPTADAPEKRTTEPSASRGVRHDVILVVEDDSRVRSVTAEALRAEGFRVLDALGPEAAIAMVTGGAVIDLVVTDVVMPRVTGIELAKAVDALRPGLPVLFVSGYAAGELHTLEDAGPTRAFLPKPFTPNQLVAAVHELLAR